MPSKRIISGAIILAGATVLSGGTAFGTQGLVLTEDSSTSLTAVLQGTTSDTVSVQYTSADHWTLTFSSPSGGTPTVSGSAIWTEPDPGSTAGNVVEQGANSDQLIIISDAPNETGLPNGFGTPDIHLDGGVLLVSFTDDGDGTVSVPDATATLPLLSLSLAGLGFVARRLNGRPASGF